MAVSKPIPEIKYDPDPRWYVLYVKSRTEKKVKERMEKKGFEVFLPLIKTMRQWSDRKKQVQVPLFNGYIFARIDPTQFTLIRMIEGVVNFVRHEKKHASVKDEQIESIQRFIQTGFHMESSPDIFTPGEKVKINFGPLKDLEGELIEIKNEKHFIVRLEVINQVLIVTVPPGYLEKA
ncbi:MAG: UpxY family transcription antiterminator [Chitinophagales bacterium]